MNKIIIYIVTLMLIHGALAKKSVPNLAEIVLQAGNCKAPGLQCKDCNSIEFCSSSLQSLLIVECSKQNPATPFCDPDTHTCTSMQPSACNSGESSYVCPGTGYYPDLEDCQKYVYCDEEKVAHRYQCDNGNVYDHKLQLCSPSTECMSYDSTDGLCSGRLNRFVSYVLDNNLYVLCSFGRAPVVLQCPPLQVFNDEEQSCMFECPHNGFFPFEKDDSKFYACTQIGDRFIKSLLHCYPGTRFVVLGDGEGVCTTTMSLVAASPTPNDELKTSTLSDESTTEKPEEVNNPTEHIAVQVLEDLEAEVEATAEKEEEDVDNNNEESHTNSIERASTVHDEETAEEEISENENKQDEDSPVVTEPVYLENNQDGSISADEEANEQKESNESVAHVTENEPTHQENNNQDGGAWTNQEPNENNGSAANVGGGDNTEGDEPEHQESHQDGGAWTNQETNEQYETIDWVADVADEEDSQANERGHQENNQDGGAWTNEETNKQEDNESVVNAAD